MATALNDFGKNIFMQLWHLGKVLRKGIWFKTTFSIVKVILHILIPWCLVVIRNVGYASSCSFIWVHILKSVLIEVYGS